ncbi:MAG: putative zinc-binding protein [Methanomicrobiaceae archaeon]|nr:putative zinc-binding protein [Methanomicrobiaceae archaeon]
MTGKILVTCSGISSTGKLTFQAANSFILRNPGVFERHLSAPAIDGGKSEMLKENAFVVVLDGCQDCCSCKKIKKAGIEQDIHIIATELGIEKRGAEDPYFSEINAVNRELKRRLISIEK